MLKLLLSFAIIGTLCTANPLNNDNNQGNYSKLESFKTLRYHKGYYFWNGTVQFFTVNKIIRILSLELGLNFKRTQNINISSNQ